MVMIDAAVLRSVQCGGASIVKVSPIFTTDSRFLIAVCGLNIKVYSVETGATVALLSGHTNEVTAVCHHPKAKLQIVSSSLDETFRVWDYEDGVLLKTINVKEKIYNVLSHPSLSSHLIYCIKHQSKTFSLVKFSIENEVKKSLLSGMDCSRKICIGAAASYIACANKHSINVTTPAANKFLKRLESGKHYGDIVCITSHPTRKCFATGHKSGNILLWRDILPKDDMSRVTPVISTFHWHSTCVGGIAFTSDASYMLSVGMEGVLVQWHYKHSDKKRDFFPRIGHEMKDIIASNDGLLYATTHADNSIKLISNMLKTKQVIEGFTASNTENNDKILHCGLQYDWRSKSCITNGKYGHLLFYQPAKDYQLYNLDIVGQNYIIDLKEEHMTYISQVAFSCKLTYEGDKHEVGTWMATVEERVVKENLQDQKLKIWKFDEKEQRWSLSMLIYHPHKSCVVKAIFQPLTSGSDRSLSLVTGSKNGQVKRWTLYTDVALSEDGSKAVQHSWSCTGSASYKNQQIIDMDISQDGSLLAAAYTSAVCVTNVDQMDTMTEAVTLPKKLKIRQLVFGRFSCQSLLLLSMNGAVAVHDLLTQSITHIINIEPTLICQDPYSDVAAIFTKDKKVTFIRPSNSAPIATVCNDSTHDVAAACFIPADDLNGQNDWLQTETNEEWMSQSRLFFVNKNMTVHCVCTEMEVENKLSSSSSMAVFRKIDEDNLQTPMANMMRKSIQSAKSRRKDDHHDDIDVVSHRKFTSSIKKLTETPCHVLPPINLLCHDFLTALLVTKNNNRTAANNETHDEDSDEEMEVDSSDEEEDTKKLTETKEEEEAKPQSHVHSFKWVKEVFQ